MKMSGTVLLSFLWMLGIVLYHAGGSGCYYRFLSDFRVGGVSFFFIVSGYFLMKHWGGGLWKWWKVEFLKRLKSLGVPCLLWTLLCLFDRSSLEPFYLWYLKFLLLFCLMSPLFVVTCQYLVEHNMFFQFFGATVLVLPWIPLPMKFCLFLSALMFSFGIGLALLQRQKSRIYSLSNWWLCVLAMVWAVVVFVRVSVDSGSVVEWPLKVYTATLLIAVSWFIVNKFNVRFTWPPMVCSTLFIYCTHGVILRYLPLFSNLGNVGFFLNGFSAFLLSIGLGCFLKKMFPRFYSLLTGNR